MKSAVEAAMISEEVYMTERLGDIRAPTVKHANMAAVAMKAVAISLRTRQQNEMQKCEVSEIASQLESVFTPVHSS
jgi:hypothetical protein